MKDSGLMSFFQWIWQAPKTNSEWQAFVSRFFQRSLFILTSILSFFLLTLAFTGDINRSPTIIALIIINLISFALLKSGRLRLAMHCFVWFAWLGLAVGSITSIGVYAPAYLTTTLLILMAGLGLSRRSTILFTGLSICFGIFMIYGHSQAWIITPTNHNLNPINMWITSSAIQLVTAYIVLAIRQTSFAMTERLRRDQELYRAIVEDQTEYIVRWKPGGIRTFANGAYLRYFKMSWEEAIGTSFYPQINEEDHDWINEKLSRISPENPIDTFEHRVVRPDGSEGWQEWSDRALYDEEGNIIEYQSVGRDITAIKELQAGQRELALTKEREAFLRDFLSTMSHDLQTPLSVMRANLQLLQRTPEKTEERIERIDKQIDKLSGMINDILTVARLEHLPELQRQPSNFAELLENSLNPLRDEAKAKNISLEAPEVSPDIVLKVDAPEFQRALSNLIGNAIKYTPQGGIVKISAFQQNNKLIIEVIDTGIGIEVQDLPHIFERFYRARNAQRFEKGTGLGLVIVKRIVELHEGTISVSSTSGQGSRFTVTLPVAQTVPA